MGDQLFKTQRYPVYSEIKQQVTKFDKMNYEADKLILEWIERRDPGTDGQMNQDEEREETWMNEGLLTSPAGPAQCVG